MVEIACGEESPKEVDQAIIGKLLAQHGQEPVVVDPFETFGDVDFEHPLRAHPVTAEAFKSRVAASARPEAVTVVMKRRFVDGLQNESHAFLYDCVPRRGHP